jgi:hypothetical protein
MGWEEIEGLQAWLSLGIALGGEQAFHGWEGEAVSWRSAPSKRDGITMGSIASSFFALLSTGNGISCQFSHDVPDDNNGDVSWCTFG